MSSHPRPLLLGYIRADVLKDRADLPQVEAQLEAFADRESCSLGTVYVERGSAPGAFDALMCEVTRDEGARGVVVPDLRHVTVVEQLVLTRHEEGARTAIFTANFTPRSGGPGAGLPETRPARHSTSRAVRWPQDGPAMTWSTVLVGKGTGSPRCWSTIRANGGTITSCRPVDGNRVSVTWTMPAR